MNLSAPVNATTSDAQGVGTILNDDAPVLLIDEITGRALALDSVTQTSDPFLLNNVTTWKALTTAGECRCLCGDSDFFQPILLRT